MTAPPGHESPYPAAPPPADEPPRWFKWTFWAVSRIAVFGAGYQLAFLAGGTDTQFTGGIAMMVGAAGVTILKGWK